MIQQFALDENGNRVYIENASPMNNYYCEVCSSKMIIKKGLVRAHHFAHVSSSKCTDTWKYDMSEWHRKWQNRFPEEYREVVRELEGCRHRADVLIEKTKTVIEFQHSKLISNEFQKRNRFYNALGYHVVWLFDLRDHYEEDCFWFQNNAGVYWRCPLETFNDFKMDEQSVDVYFQIEYPAEENDSVQNFLKLCKETGDDDFGSDDEIYYRQHKNDKGKIIKVSKASRQGMGFFYTDQVEYTIDLWVDFMKNAEMSRYDTIPALWKKHGCKKVAVFKKKGSDYYVKITSDPNANRGRCYGDFSKNRYKFEGNIREVYYLNDPSWILIWTPQE